MSGLFNRRPWGRIRPSRCFGLAPGVCSGSIIQFVTMANCTLSRAVGGGMQPYRWRYILSYSDIYGQKTFACKYFLNPCLVFGCVGPVFIFYPNKNNMINYFFKLRLIGFGSFSAKNIYQTKFS